MDLLNNHVTIRNFTEQQISPNLLDNIIYSGTRASTTGNMQLYSIIISQGDQKNDLIPLHFNQSAAKQAPVLITFIADFNRFSKWCSLNDAVPGYNNFISFFNAAIDALLVAQNVCVAAENNGLGICYLGTTTYNAKEIIDILKLPKLTFPVTTLAIGYPVNTPELTDRLPLDGIVHYGTYSDYTENQISTLYEFKEKLETSRKFVSENNKTTLAQVFTDIRYKKTDNDFFSEKMLIVLRAQGFLA